MVYVLGLKRPVHCLNNSLSLQTIYSLVKTFNEFKTCYCTDFYKGTVQPRHLTFAKAKWNAAVVPMFLLVYRHQTLAKFLWLSYLTQQCTLHITVGNTWVNCLRSTSPNHKRICAVLCRILVTILRPFHITVQRLISMTLCLNCNTKEIHFSSSHNHWDKQLNRIETIKFITRYGCMVENSKVKLLFSYCHDLWSRERPSFCSDASCHEKPSESISQFIFSKIWKRIPQYLTVSRNNKVLPFNFWDKQTHCGVISFKHNAMRLRKFILHIQF
jgi:hypothetical protein